MDLRTHLVQSCALSGLAHSSGTQLLLMSGPGGQYSETNTHIPVRNHSCTLRLDQATLLFSKEPLVEKDCGLQSRPPCCTVDIEAALDNFQERC